MHVSIQNLGRFIIAIQGRSQQYDPIVNALAQISRHFVVDHIANRFIEASYPTCLRAARYRTGFIDSLEKMRRRCDELKNKYEQ